MYKEGNVLAPLSEVLEVAKIAGCDASPANAICSPVGTAFPQLSREFAKIVDNSDIQASITDSTAEATNLRTREHTAEGEGEGLFSG